MTLFWIVLIPLIGGLLCVQIEHFGERWPRWIALLTMIMVTVIAAQLLWQSNFSLLTLGAAPQWTIEVQYPWIDRFGINLHLGIDGLSALLILLTGIFGILSVVCSWDEVRRSVGAFYLNILLVTSGVMGIFLALDMFLFFLFWELMLVPMYFLIALWGRDTPQGEARINAAIKFFIYTQASGMILLLAILGLVLTHYSSTGVLSFDYNVLRGTQLTPLTEYILMLGFFVAFAVKLPVVPLHSWILDAHEQAPIAGNLALLIKTAAYGLLRFALPLFPHASHDFAPIVMALGCLSIIYAAVLAFAQTDIKRFVAYTSISHAGFILIAIYAGQIVSLQGAVVQMFAGGLSAAALFILCEQLYQRLRTYDLTAMGGLWSNLPLLPAFALFFVTASLGLPGTGNFVGEFLILLGTFQVAPWTAVIAATGLVLATVYSLTLMHRAFLGMPNAAAAPALNGPVFRETLVLSSLMAMLLVLGFYPQPVLTTAASSVAAVRAAYLPQSATITTPARAMSVSWRAIGPKTVFAPPSVTAASVAPLAP